jgi:hypothetical protein
VIPADRGTDSYLLKEVEVCCQNLVQLIQEEIIEEMALKAVLNLDHGAAYRAENEELEYQQVQKLTLRIYFPHVGIYSINPLRQNSIICVVYEEAMKFNEVKPKGWRDDTGSNPVRYLHGTSNQ